MKIVGDFHLPLLLLQMVTMHNEYRVAVISVLIIVGLTDISLHVMIPLLFYFSENLLIPINHFYESVQSFYITLEIRQNKKYFILNLSF